MKKKKRYLIEEKDLDLSEENVKKTIMYDDLKVDDLRTNRNRIGVIISDYDCSNIEIDWNIYTLNQFKEKYSGRKILSTHEYKEYLSVMIERILN